MQKETAIAHALTSEVMDENYRGTQRIKKHGLRVMKTQTMWNKLTNLTRVIIQKYVNYAGTRE